MTAHSSWELALDWSRRFDNMDPVAVRKLYQQEVPPITAVDIAIAGGDRSVRWNDKLGRYERREPNGRWL